MLRHGSQKQVPADHTGRPDAATFYRPPCTPRNALCREGVTVATPPQWLLWGHALRHESHTRDAPFGVATVRFFPAGRLKNPAGGSLPPPSARTPARATAAPSAKSTPRAGLRTPHRWTEECAPAPLDTSAHQKHQQPLPARLPRRRLRQSTHHTEPYVYTLRLMAVAPTDHHERCVCPSSFPLAAPGPRLPSVHGPSAKPQRSPPALVTVPAFPNLPDPGAAARSRRVRVSPVRFDV